MQNKFRILSISLCFMFILTGMGGISSGTVKAFSETRAAWISYLDFEAEGLKDKSEGEFRKNASALFDEIMSKNLNTVYVQVRIYNDAIYPSEYFRWSDTITSNSAGPGYDPLEIMVEIAHQKGLRLEAWMNPYRVSYSTTRTANVKNTSTSDELSKMIEYTSPSGQTCLILDPANAEARSLIVSAVDEIVNNYDIDGIHFDDYFYQEGSYGYTTASERRNNVNILVRDVYSKIKSIREEVLFGISPRGDVAACLEIGADVVRWLSLPGYIDYLCPQLYWSDAYGSAGTTTMYSNRLNGFVNINTNGTEMYAGLALYKVAEKPAGDPGWVNSSYNLSEQVEIAESKGLTGYALFSSRYLSYTSTQTELNNLNQKTIIRLSGSDRYATSAAISKAGWTQADTVILTTGQNYPDALAASALTKYKNAPILLTGINAIDQNVISEIQRLKATKAILVGGTDVVGTGVESQLKSLGIAITRISGSDRFDTSVKVAEMIGTNNGIIVATGLNFPDALSIAPIAAIRSIPILLSPASSLDPKVSAYIANKSIPVSYVIGGNDVLSDNVASSLPNSKRLSGTDRYATNMSVINEFSGYLDFDTVYFATGLDFPDALSGSALAAKNNSPIILIGKDSELSEAINLIKSKNVKHVVILGGTDVVSRNVEAAVADAFTNQ